MVHLQLAGSPRPLPLDLQRMVFEYALSHPRERDALLVALARRPDLDVSLEARLPQVSSARVFVAWLSRPSRSLEEKLSVLASESRPSVLAAVASDPGLPAELLVSLADRLSPSLAVALLGNPSTPEELHLPCVAALDSSSPLAPLSSAVVELLAARPELHDQVAALCQARVARLLAPSEHLSEPLVLRVFSVLRSAVFEPLEEPGASQHWELREVGEALVKVLQARLAAGSFSPALAQVLLMPGEPRTSVTEELASLVAIALGNAVEFDELLSSLRTSADLDFLEGERRAVAQGLASQDAEERRRAVAVHCALLENEHLSPELLSRVAANLPTQVRRVLEERFRKGFTSDVEQFVVSLGRGPLPRDVVVTFLSAQPQAAAAALSAIALKSGWPMSNLLVQVVSSPGFDPAWVDGLSGEVLERFLSDELLAVQTVARLEVLLGASPRNWELFLGLDSFNGTLAERAWAAVNL